MRTLLVSFCAATMIVALWSPAGAASADRRTARLRPTHDGVSHPDKDGRGRAKIAVLVSEQRLCYRVTVKNMTVFHVDIRRSRNDEVVRELYHGQPSEQPVAGCKRNMARRVLEALRDRPKRFYVYVAEYNALGQPPSEIAGTLKVSR